MAVVKKLWPVSKPSVDEVRYRHAELLSDWAQLFPAGKMITPEALCAVMQDCIYRAESEPVRLWQRSIEINEPTSKRPGKTVVRSLWIFKGFSYHVDGYYTDEQAKLLVLEEFDKQRQYFERLKQKFDSLDQDVARARPRISEKVRIEVWQRDGGKCARCGNRENLEYDHIVPLSCGGSNTARNIELLCERCNRSKGNNIG